MQPNLENIKKKIQDNRDLVDRITSKIPGFTGYVEKAEINTADRVIKNLIVARIQGFKNEINSLSSKLVKKSDHAHLSELESLNINLEKLLKKCQYADFGADSSFSGVKITDEDQNRLLEYDWRMISSLDDFDKLFTDLDSSESEGIGSLIESINDKLKEFEKNFDERKNILLEVI